MLYTYWIFYWKTFDTFEITVSERKLFDHFIILKSEKSLKLKYKMIKHYSKPSRYFCGEKWIFTEGKTIQNDIKILKHVFRSKIVI